MQVCEKATITAIVLIAIMIIAIAVISGFQNDNRDGEYDLTIIYDCKAVMADRTNLYSAETKEECQNLINSKIR